MIRKGTRWGSWALVLVVVAAGSIPAQAGDGNPSEVNGTLTEIEGMTVLRVWGTPHERGYAHGYLMAEQIAAMLDQFLEDGPLGRGSIEHYQNQTLPKLARMKIDPAHEAEMRAIVEGIEARLGGPAKMSILGRPPRYEDIVAVNCTGDLCRSGCSSFAAWGEMTADGGTIGARNMDWPVIQCLLDTQIILVNVPEADSGELGWVSITWPTFVGVITGMNSEGLTVATHDAGGHPPSVSAGFTPYGWTFRRALEKGHPATARDDIARVIREEVSIVGNNMMVTRPFTGDGPGAFVFEFDGNLSLDGGLTIREPEPTDSFLVCTNHFRNRAQPLEGFRFGRLSRMLRIVAEKTGKRHVDIKRAWKSIGGVCTDDNLTYSSAVFEPNKRLMHVALTKRQRDAPKCKKVTLNVADLLAGEFDAKPGSAPAARQ
jgi:hypothetical protein